jgi:hypothetical protein
MRNGLNVSSSLNCDSIAYAILNGSDRISGAPPSVCVFGREEMFADCSGASRETFACWGLWAFSSDHAFPRSGLVKADVALHPLQNNRILLPQEERHTWISTSHSDRRNMANTNEPPLKTGADIAHTIAKAGLSTLPIVGGPAAELFAAIVQPPIERRRDEWMRSVGQLLSELQIKGVDIETLKNNEQFIDTVLQATQVALRNHQERKRSALRNAIANSAVGRTPNDMTRQMFLRYIDEFTEEHLMILELFADPPGWFARHGNPFPNLSMGGLSHILENAFPVLQNARPLYDQIWKDLYQRGLVNTEGLHAMMTGNGLTASRVSDFGERFLAFIRTPEAF